MVIRISDKTQNYSKVTKLLVKPKFICTKLANGKRKIELETLKDLINDQEYTFSNDISQTNVFNIFTNEFPTGSGKNTFKDCIFIEDTKISKPFKTCLENDEFKSMVKEIIEYALDQYNKHYKNTYKDTNFVLYQKNIHMKMHVAC